MPFTNLQTSREDSPDSLEAFYQRFVDEGYMTMSVTPEGELEYCWTDLGLMAHNVATASLGTCGAFQEIEPTRWMRIKRRVPTAVSSAAVLLSVQALVRVEWHFSIVQWMFHIH